MNEKVPLTASNRRKRELAREGDLVTYKKKRKTIDPSIVVRPNTVNTTNKGVSEPVPTTESIQAAFGARAESAQAVNIPQGLEFETEYTQDVGPSNKSLLRSFRFQRARSIAIGQIFSHFPKLAGIPKEMDSEAYGHCTCWKWNVSATDRYGGTALLKFREALDNYKLEDHHEHASLSPNAHGTMQTRGRSGGFDQQIIALNDQLQKLKEDKKEFKTNINLRETLKEKISECDLLKETIEQMKEDIELKRVVDEQYALEFADLPRQLNVKILECKNLEEKNISLEAVLRQKFGLEDCNQSLSVELNKKEVWRQTLKKALASEGMGDMGDPIFEELFEHNKRFFTIAQQGPKGDYQEDLISTAVTLENLIIARREKMSKKKKMQ
ncbi:hypothetical protein GIB67_039287 [Kingdonia uniflora]|uniref:Uncharacterized protein n=1 Tax=Kingdonia uniflora TaxID=39325 RepID=A0A7J7MM41_9MAGN|nr:hypothetical protein GIB67_039287 [Kingdonia uniflora]